MASSPRGHDPRSAPPPGPRRPCSTPGSSTRAPRAPPKRGCATTPSSSRSSRSTARTTACRRNGTRRCGPSARRRASSSTSRRSVSSRSTRRRSTRCRPSCASASARSRRRTSTTTTCPPRRATTSGSASARRSSRCATKGKLGAVVFQFPPWVVNRRSNREHVLECARRLPGDAIAVEFRNRTWFDAGNGERTLAFEREQRARQRDRRRAAGLHVEHPGGVGSDDARARRGPPARTQSRHLGEEGPRHRRRALRLSLLDRRDEVARRHRSPSWATAPAPCTCCSTTATATTPRRTRPSSPRSWARERASSSSRTPRRSGAAGGPAARRRRRGGAERADAPRREDGDRARRAPPRARCRRRGRG